MNRVSKNYTVGSLWKGKYGDFEIVEYVSKKRIKVQFLDTGFIKWTDPKSIKNLTVKDPYFKNIFGVGCVGQTKTNLPDGKVKKSYHTWRGMLRRCYDPKDWITNPTYQKVSVCEDWCCFETYEKWYDSHVIEGFEIDKDFTVLGCNLYSPDTCSFVPSSINSLLGKRVSKNKGYPTGVSYHTRDNIYNAKLNKEGRLVHLGDFDHPEDAFLAYKVAKEGWIKEVAEYEYSKGNITATIYKNLMSYEVTT